MDSHEFNFPMDALKAGLERMREASHGAMTTEQAHASGSIMMRMHRAYGDATMRDSAFAFQAWIPLMPSEFERKAQMLQDRVQMLLKGNPNKVGARQAWVGDLISIASKKHSQGKMQGKFYSMKLVANSGGSRQAHYEKVAQGRRNEALRSGGICAPNRGQSPAAGRRNFRKCFLCL